MAAPSSWKAWRSVSVAWARMGTEVPAKLEELLAGIGAAIDAVGGSFTMRYTTVAVTAARPAPPHRHLRYPPLAGTPKLSAGTEISCPRSRRTPVCQSGVRTDR